MLYLGHVLEVEVGTPTTIVEKMDGSGRVSNTRTRENILDAPGTATIQVPRTGLSIGTDSGKKGIQPTHTTKQQISKQQISRTCGQTIHLLNSLWNILVYLDQGTATMENVFAS